MAAVFFLSLLPLVIAVPFPTGVANTGHHPAGQGGNIPPRLLGMVLASQYMGLAGQEGGHGPGQSFMGMAGPMGHRPLPHMASLMTNKPFDRLSQVRGLSQMGGQFGMGHVGPPAGSSQRYIMEKFQSPIKAVASSLTPTSIGVGADYSFFGGNAGPGVSLGGQVLVGQPSVPLADLGHTPLGAASSAQQNSKNLHYNVVTMETPSPNSRHLPPTTPPAPVDLKAAEQIRISNLFSVGEEKAVEPKPTLPEPADASIKPRGLRPIPGLNAPLYDQSPPASDTAGMALRAPCDQHVDAIFAFDDVKHVWMVRESLLYYTTQLRPSKTTRIGVVLCGRQKSFFTALHQDFSGLLSSLEDLQHANATLDPAQHMPDTPAQRSENNPYPPGVTKDFAQGDMGCLETSYTLFTRNPPNADRLLTLVGTKERWSEAMYIEEARYLHYLNISLITLADGALSPAAQETLRTMASSPDKFRFVNDNVTLRALPAMIGSAICRPQKGDVTLTVQRKTTQAVQQPDASDCRLVDPTTMEKTMDFGQFFGLQSQRVTCPAGLVPNPRLCTCV